jgi:hypothetical protein
MRVFPFNLVFLFSVFFLHETSLASFPGKLTASDRQFGLGSKGAAPIPPPTPNSSTSSGSSSPRSSPTSPQASSVTRAVNGGTQNIGQYRQAIPRLIQEQDEIQRAAQKFERSMERFEAEHKAKAQEFQRQADQLQQSVRQLGSAPSDASREPPSAQTPTNGAEARGPSYSPQLPSLLSGMGGGGSAISEGRALGSVPTSREANALHSEEATKSKERKSRVTDRESELAQNQDSKEEAARKKDQETGDGAILASVVGKEGDLSPNKFWREGKKQRRGAAQRSPFAALEGLMMPDGSTKDSMASLASLEESAPSLADNLVSSNQGSGTSRGPASYGSAPLPVDGPDWNLNREDVAEAKRDLASQVQEELNAAQGILGENSAGIFGRVSAVYRKKQRDWLGQEKNLGQAKSSLPLSESPQRPGLEG